MASSDSDFDDRNQSEISRKGKEIARSFFDISAKCKDLGKEFLEKAKSNDGTSKQSTTSEVVTGGKRRAMRDIDMAKSMAKKKKSVSCPSSLKGEAIHKNMAVSYSTNTEIDK